MEDNAVILVRVSDSVKSAHKRIDTVESEVKDLRKLTEAILKVDGKVDNITSDMNEMKSVIKQVTFRPVQWWDKLIAAIIGACASGLVAAVLAQILK